MSKMDAVRAMREARYAEAQSRAGRAAKPAARPAAPKQAAPKQDAPQQDTEPPVETDDLCGHRNISGRTCTRERGHSAKSHRYS
jgi:hypothetical protein